MAIIEVKNLDFAYSSNPEKKVLQDVSFDIDEGTVTAVIGLSGCGKTTLCQILCGIIPQCIEGELSGEILVGGTEIKDVPLSKLACKIGLVMQDPDRQLVATTVEDELAFGPENLARVPEDIRNRVNEIMGLLKIDELALKNPVRLSGGQKQVVAIGSVLTLNPKIMILDEPMSHLDEEGRILMLKTIKTLKETGKTVIVVEHDYMTMDFADKWLMLEDGQVKAFDRPANIILEGTYR